MEIEEIMRRVGGVADRASLVRLTSRRDVDRALREGVIVRDGRGRYAVPLANEALRAANALNGVVSHRSAAILHGWPVKTVPERPDVTVPGNRKVSERRRAGVTLHRSVLRPGDVTGPATSTKRTLRDCLRTLPLGDSLAVADSALRMRSVTKASLVDLAAGVRGTGAPSARRVAAAADGRAANPFESALRAVTLDVPGLDFVPQLPIYDHDFSVQPDLVDPDRRIVLEADSFAWHGDRSSLRWDAQRYNNLVIRGWLLLRFAWEDVMHDPDYVRRTLTRLAALVDPR